MKKLLYLLAFGLSVQFSFAQRISLQPSILEFHLDKGGVQSQSIHLTNLSDKKISFQAYLADWLRDSTGGHQYFRADTLKRSCATWVHLDKNFIEVAPGQSAELIVQMQAPTSPEAFQQMKWAMLFLQSADEQEGGPKSKEMQTQIKELLRIGVHIYQTPPAITTYEAKAVSLLPVNGEKNSYELTMKNTGTVMLQCKAYMELTNVADGKQYKVDKVEFPVFPDGIRRVKFQLPATIPTGKYSSLAILDIGEDMPLEAIEKTIELK